MHGMTWNHPRGLSPLLAASRRWAQDGGRAITWDARSLQDFETYPVEDLARRYDLIVIDHPHVGAVAAQGALLPLPDHPDAAAGSVGGSYDSYRWDDRQWAYPIDAAAQVMAWAPDRLDAPPSSWAEILRMAERGRVALPMRAPHALMALMTLCGLSGIALVPRPDRLFPDEAIAAAGLLLDLASRVGPVAARQDPIAALAAMATIGSPIEVAPLIYGYISYAQPGEGDAAIRFANLIPNGAAGPQGSVLGGTGIAVSAHSGDPAASIAFARWLSSGAVQRGIVGANGGQPAHSDAWDDDTLNADSADFYRATRHTLDRAWMRPRGSGYMAFQDAASQAIVAAVDTPDAPARLVATLNRLWTETA